MHLCSNRNTFTLRRGRFNEVGSKFEPIFISTISFENSLNSVDIEEEYFTNYSSSNEKKEYKIINELHDEINNGNIKILNKYMFDELYYKDKVIDRLLNIINNSNNNIYSKNDLPNIFKLKNRVEPQIHLYIIINNSLARILLIDLYHLSIPGNLYINNRFIKSITLDDLFKLYEKIKKNKYSLNNIKIESKLLTTV